MPEPLPWGDQDTIRHPEDWGDGHIAVDVAPTLDAAQVRAAEEWGKHWFASTLVAREWLRVLPPNPDNEDEMSEVEAFGSKGFVHECQPADTGAREFWHLTDREPEEADR